MSTEAQSSINTFGVHPAGWNIQITLRDDNEAKLLERFGQLVVKLEGLGVTPKSVGASPAPSKVANAPAVYNAADPNQELESIEIDSITLASGGEHPRWVVKGGWAKAFGITVWPETLQAAGLINKLDPMKENFMDAGMVAYYTKKPKKDDPSKMTADKVVRIEILGATPPEDDGEDIGF